MLNCFQYGSTPAYGLTEINESFSLVMSQNWYVSARFDYNGGLYYSYVDGTYSYFRWLSSSISKGYNSGTNASTIIDYKSIESACENIMTVANDGMQDISDAINKVQIGSEALSVADKNMQPILEEVSDFIKTLPEQAMSATIDEAKERALQVYNEKQEELNEKTQQEVNAEAQSAE